MTKYKDLQPSQIKDTPFTNIGAQDLCSIEANWSGLIRKEGALERNLKRFGALSKVTNVQWRQYFVVLSQGCVYVFHDQSSASPKIHFSLKNFGRLQRNYQHPNSFDILPVSEDGKVYRFTCATDAQRLEWMRALYVSLLTVHTKPLPIDEHFNKKNEYTILESEIVKPPSNKIYEIDDESSDDDGDRYDKPDEIAMLRADKNKYSKDPTSFKNVLIPPDPKKRGKPRSKSEPSDSTGESPDVPTLPSSPEDESPIFEDNDDGEEYSVDAASSEASLLKQKPKIAPKPAKTNSELQESKPKPRYANSPPDTKTNQRYANTREDTSEKTKSLGGYKTMKSPDQSRKTKSLGRDAVSKSTGTHKTEKTDMYINMKDVSQGYVECDPASDPSLEYMFDGNRENSARVLDVEPVQTFLIRNSTEAGKKVLVVKSAFGLKSYKIETQGSKLLIDSEALFDNYQQLVDYYKKNKLPNIGVCLKRGFRAKKVENNGDDGDYEPVEKPIKTK